MQFNVNELADKLAPVFKDVAAKIGEGGAFAWEVVMRQQYVTALLGVFWALCGVAVLVVTWKMVPKLWAKTTDYDDIRIAYAIWAVTATIGGGLAFLIGVHEAITHFINPQYYALQFFIDIVRPATVTH